jgi:hypothetical protein
MLAPPERGARAALQSTSPQNAAPMGRETFRIILTPFICFPQAAKVYAMQVAYRKKEAETPRSQAPNAGDVRSLGLLAQKEQEAAEAAEKAVGTKVTLKSPEAMSSKEKQRVHEAANVHHGTLLPAYTSNLPK